MDIKELYDCKVKYLEKEIIVDVIPYPRVERSCKF